MKTGERLQPVERRGLLEDLGVELDGSMRGINTRAAASGLFGVTRVRRAVGAEKKLRVAACGCGNQRAAVRLALQQRQAVMVRPQAALEHRVTVKQ